LEHTRGDSDKVRPMWEKTKNLVKAGDYDHFPKTHDNSIAHVRPKGRDSSDLMDTPQGGKEKMMCFFLNRGYVMTIVK